MSSDESTEAALFEELEESINYATHFELFREMTALAEASDYALSYAEAVLIFRLTDYLKAKRLDQHPEPMVRGSVAIIIAETAADPEHPFWRLVLEQFPEDGLD